MAGFKKTAVDTEDECRKLCCFLGDECVTWQYQLDSKRCFIGPVVRFGLEKCNGKIFGNICGNWCEPNEPIKWHGKKILSRDRDTGQCIWGDDLPSQCFGYGPEKFNTANGQKERMSTSECRESCCKDKRCQVNLIYKLQNNIYNNSPI